MARFSDYIVYVDESGDHSLEKVDAQYPIFVLVFCLFEKERYAAEVAPAMIRFKFEHFGHDQAVLHEREIRKESGVFAFLRNPDLRTPFYDGLNTLIARAPCTVVASVINKGRLTATYREPDNPYHLALGLGLERLYRHLHARGCHDGDLHVVFEKRGGKESGGKEDRDLELEFRRVCDGENALNERLPFAFVLADKQRNSTGLQLADLFARPIGLHVFRPTQPNRAWDLIQPKLRRSPQGGVRGWGLKVFP